jgi:hypothetical protein
MQSRLSGWILQYKDKIWLCWAIVSQWRSVVCGFWMIYFRFARLFLVLHLGRIGERIFSKKEKDFTFLMICHCHAVGGNISQIHSNNFYFQKQIQSFIIKTQAGK